MVLTRRGYKAISRWLPNEIMTEIIQEAPQNDLASLCRVSKLFHGLVVPVLYRAVHLDHDGAAAFCDAILSNPGLAELVRSLTMAARRGAWPDYPVRRQLYALTFPHLLCYRVSIGREDWPSILGDDTL
ncbi:hypothetical protein DFH09DRAFT_1281621, partial [Mycena vulgaris]